jgi:isopentenyl diphosphate isomerase/L-lactate dehydrogenase-like FMN-dependent dehydrogenase
MTDLVNDIRAEIAKQKAGEVLPFAFEDWEAAARTKLDPAPFGYIVGGASGGDTMRENRKAFERYRIVPRMLRDVAERQMAVKLFGTSAAAPFLLAPVAAQGIMHPDGERATARAARSLGIPMVLSTMASTPLEDIAKLMDPVKCWFQLYAGKNREFAKSLIQRAETAGYSAVVATVDLPLLSWREEELKHAYLPFLENEGIANHLSDPTFGTGDPKELHRRAIDYLENPRFTWKDIEWLRKQTRLPLLLKGILHPDDALLAIEHGADGIIVSNHGGRQVDGSIAALDALPLVRKAVKKRIPLLMDSGVRRGADILKAIALGASAVLIGRPYAYGLAVAGETGVRQVLRNLMAEFELNMALSGCRRIKDITKDLIV